MSENENSGALDEVVRSAFDNARARIAVVGTGARLALAELKLVGCRAGLAVGIVIVLAGAVLVGWVMVLILAAFVLYGHGFSPVQAILLTLLFHTLALAGLVICLLRIVKSLSFKHTRQALQGRSDRTVGADDKMVENTKA